VSLKSSLMNFTAPEITEASNPKIKPPSETTGARRTVCAVDWFIAGRSPPEAAK
jgi:hypothetical protein